MKDREDAIVIADVGANFVMDIADTEKGFKIIECGCINCAGFYAADMQKLFISLENAFG